MALSLLTRTVAGVAGVSAAVSPLLGGLAAAQTYDGGYYPQAPAPSYQSAPGGDEDDGQAYDQGAPSPDQTAPDGYQGPPPQGYPQGYSGQGYAPQGYPNQGYQPQGYPSQPYPQSYPQQQPTGQAYGSYGQLPPPPGYQPTPDYAANPQADQRYEAYAEDWAQRYCVKAQNNTGAGAVIGGLLGALVGSSVAGRHDRGAGAIVGGVAGAAGGAAVGSANSDATSPGCPPGFVVRAGAPRFAFGGYDAPYEYAAPAGYQPWIFVSGRWNYRPYPYHVWYYRHYGNRRPYARPYGRGWRRGY